MENQTLSQRYDALRVDAMAILSTKLTEYSGSISFPEDTVKPVLYLDNMYLNNVEYEVLGIDANNLQCKEIDEEDDHEIELYSIDEISLDQICLVADFISQM